MTDMTEINGTGGELAVGPSGELAGLIQQQGLDGMLKPLIREIHLFDTRVAGTTHLADQSVLDEIVPGERLSLVRENNKFDDNAIVLYTEGRKKLGYVPEKDNVVFARLMDAGKRLTARVRNQEIKGSFHSITISIFLVDF